MATTKSVWGIDIGRCALKAIKLRTGAEGKIELLAFDYIEHAKILSQPDADRVELINAALEQFLSRNDISKDQVVVSVPGQHTLARFSKLPPVAPKRIPDIVRYEADQQIPFDMDEVIWDYQTFQEEGKPDIEVGIFAMKRELIKEHLLHFEQASVEPVGVQSGPLAVYNAAHFEEVLSADTTILLDIGAEGTDLVIGTPNRLWTRAIPIGGNSFTDALMKAFKLSSFAKAEGLKRTAATSKYARQTFQAMRPVFADLVQELQRSLGFYSSTHRDAKVEKVVAVGDTFLLPGLQKYLNQNLGLPVEIPESLKKVTPIEGANVSGLKEHVPGAWVAYGLALQGLELTKVSSNLLPTEMAKQVVWRKKRPAFAAAAACLVLAGALVWFRKTADMRVLAAGAEGGDPHVKDVAEASAVLVNGPSASLPDRAKAELVSEAGAKMSEALKSLAGKGETERKQSEALLQFVKNQSVVPKLVSLIHQALPKMEGALGEASTGAQFAAAASGVPRPERKQVFIETMSMHYVPDLNDPTWPKSFEGEPPINDFTGTPIPGILVKLVCLSPNQGGLSFINDKFVTPLRSLGRTPGNGFYFDRVHYRGEKVESAAAKPGRAGGRAGAAAGGRPAAATTPGANLDPVTGESMDDDWRFDVWIDVLLRDFEDAAEPPPQEKPQPKPAPKRTED